jgi:hypothetical protein
MCCKITSHLLCMLTKLFDQNLSQMAGYLLSMRNPNIFLFNLFLVIQDTLQNVVCPIPITLLTFPTAALLSHRIKIPQPYHAEKRSHNKSGTAALLVRELQFRWSPQAGRGDFCEAKISGMIQLRGRRLYSMQHTRPASQPAFTALQEHTRQENETRAPSLTTASILGLVTSAYIIKAAADPPSGCVSGRSSSCWSRVFAPERQQPIPQTLFFQPSHTRAAAIIFIHIYPTAASTHN